MPIYEYTCQSCKSKFEKLVRSMADEAKVICPSCGSKKTEKALSVFAVTEKASKPASCAHCCGDGPCPMQ
ncbi:MAG: FmdB family zinc ribbon protein [Bacillota bacterium]